jgi:hypothetical protein
MSSIIHNSTEILLNIKKKLVCSEAAECTEMEGTVLKAAHALDVEFIQSLRKQTLLTDALLV